MGQHRDGCRPTPVLLVLYTVIYSLLYLPKTVVCNSDRQGSFFEGSSIKNIAASLANQQHSCVCIRKMDWIFLDAH